MFRLLIVISLITSMGKTRSQWLTVPGAINVQIISPLALDPRRFMVPQQGQLVSFPPQVVTRQNSLQPVRSRDRLEPNSRNGGDLNLRPPTLNENPPSRRIFIPERAPNITRRDEAKIGPDNDTRNINFTLENSTLNKTSKQTQKPLEINGTQPDISAKNITNLMTENRVVIENQNKSVVVNGSSEADGTTGKTSPPTIIDKATGVEVTLDERASFEGDKCPTGYVRVNDKCVEIDKDP